MARRSTVRSGTFFLRMVDLTDGGTMQTTSQDVSSFVNVLEGELLRIKQIWWQWGSDGGGPVRGADLGASAGCGAIATLSTDSRTTVGSISTNDVISGNTLYAHSDSGTNIDFITNETSVNPKDFDTDGYLVATDAIHLNVNQASGDLFANDIAVKVMMECEIVKLSLSDAQAVLVSQAG